MSPRVSVLLAPLAGLCLVFLAGEASSAALDLNLAFASLPSAQGWTYVTAGSHAAATEASIFSLGGGALIQNSLGQANGSAGGSILYVQPGSVTATDSKRILARIRCLAVEGSASATLGQGGFIFGFNTGSVQYAFGLTPTRVSILQPGGTTVLAATYDNTQFHDYQFDFNPPSSYQLYRDGVLIHSGSGGFAFSSNRWFFGDGTGGANARGEITALRFIQDVATPATPGTWGRVKDAYR